MGEATAEQPVSRFIHNPGTPRADFASFSADWWGNNAVAVERYDDEHFAANRSTLEAILRQFERHLYNPGLMKEMLSGFLREEAEKFKPDSREEKRTLELAELAK